MIRIKVTIQLMNKMYNILMNQANNIKMMITIKVIVILICSITNTAQIFRNQTR